LRDLGNDRVTFRHDVLREWAIANLLFADSALVQQCRSIAASAWLGKGGGTCGSDDNRTRRDSARWSALSMLLVKREIMARGDGCPVGFGRSEIGM